MNRANYRKNMQNEHFLPHLVLNNICDYLNNSELKEFRLVCIHWYSVATLHIQNKGHLQLTTRKHEKFKLAISKVSGEHFPVRNLKLSICPRMMGCKCEDCHDPELSDSDDDEDEAIKFEESSIRTIVGKCSSGIKSLNLEELRYNKVDMPQNHFRVNVEQLLLREEFRILKHLSVQAPFKITNNSGISSVFRKLTSLEMNFRCCEEVFMSNIFKNCFCLRALAITITLEDDDYDLQDDISSYTCTLKILNALKDAKKENEYLQIEELTINAPFSESLSTEELTTIFIKIRELNFKLKILHVPIGSEWWYGEGSTERGLMNEIWNLLENQKDTLSSLKIPNLPDDSQVVSRDFPRMKNLKDLTTVFSSKFSLIQFQQKMPHLQSLKIESSLFTKIPPNVIPCVTLQKLELENVERRINMNVFFGFRRLFPNVKCLKMVLQSYELRTLWRMWPRLTELNLTVRCDAYQLGEDPFEAYIDIHAEFIGIPENVCEVIIESAVPFVSLKAENYNHNIRSLRNLTELRKITLSCEFTCNLELMLGILPIKNLTEVYVTDGEMTIDCVQHLLRNNPNITRWEFTGKCSLDYLHRRFENTRGYPWESVKWTISSNNDNKHEPSYNCKVRGLYGKKLEWYNARLRSVENFGRGRCLFWLPKTCNVRPSPYVFK